MNRKIFVSAAALILSVFAIGSMSAFAKANSTVGEGKAPAPKAHSAASSAAVSSADEAESMLKMNGFTDADRRSPADASRRALLQGSVAGEQKEILYDRMLNTEDYYKTLEGKYRRTVPGKNSYTVEFKVVNDAKHLSLETYSGSDRSQQVSYCDGSTIKTVASDSQCKESTLTRNFAVNRDAEKLNFVPLLKSEKRIVKNSSGVNTYFYRPDLNNLYFARESIVPQETAFGFLADFSKWKITGNEIVAGRNCAVLQGTLSGEYAQKVNAYSYKMWVDFETGFLLKEEDFGKNGAQTDSLETLNLSVNCRLQPQELAAEAKRLIPQKYLQQ